MRISQIMCVCVCREHLRLCMFGENIAEYVCLHSVRKLQIKFASVW